MKRYELRAINWDAASGILTVIVACDNNAVKIVTTPTELAAIFGKKK